MASRIAKKSTAKAAEPPAPAPKKRAATETATTTPRKRAPVRPKAASPAAVPPEVRQKMIEEAAYARFVARGYAHGYSLIDWLEAENEVDRRLAGG
ncbi:MAG: DUF2934 domain-containing protein [Betaproteobacteria bacterium]